MQKKWKPTLNMQEVEWLRNNMLHIRECYISPMEGYEYHLLRFGDGGGRGKSNVLKYAKSPRACFSWAKRHLTPLALDFAVSPPVQHDTLLKNCGCPSCFREHRKASKA